MSVRVLFVGTPSRANRSRVFTNNLETKTQDYRMIKQRIDPWTHWLKHFGVHDGTRRREKKLDGDRKEHWRTVRFDGVNSRNEKSNAGNAEETWCWVMALRVERSARWRGQFAQQSISPNPATTRENRQAGEPSAIKQDARSVAAKTTHSVQTVQVKGLLSFTTVVMEAPMLEKKNVPCVREIYDGFIDSKEHLHSFVNTMVFYSSSDPVWCRVFSLSLKGEALTWFNTLPPNMVDCFTAIHTLFDRQYVSRRARVLLALINTKHVVLSKWVITREPTQLTTGLSRVGFEKNIPR